MRFQPRNLSHERERRLRRESTYAEQQLWRGLRRLRTFKFRRQHRIQNFAVDFYCPEVQLVVEVDGSAHEGENARVRDWERDAALRKLGLHVLHIRNELVI